MKFWLFLLAAYVSLCFFTYQEASRYAPMIGEWVAANEAVRK